jgi:hypothetical protein
VADDTDRTHQAVLERGDVELAQQRTTVRPRRAIVRIDAHAAHRAHVHEEAAVGTAEGRRRVATRPDLDLEVVVLPEQHGGSDLLRVRRTGDDGGPAVVDRVPEPAGVVIRRVIRSEHLRTRAPELIDVLGRELGNRLTHRRSMPGGCRGFDVRLPAGRPVQIILRRADARSGSSRIPTAGAAQCRSGR